MQKNILPIFTFLIIWGNIFTLPAQKVTLDAAKDKAISFLTRPNNNSAIRKAPRKAPQLVLANDREEFFIFNDEANGGYVIVSGDERTPDVLAYSDNGHYNSNSVPCNMQMVLDGYAEQISYLNAHPEYKMPTPKKAEETIVAPLLGETAWSQYSPYNNMCPTINGEHCVTGCVATATAQIMYYHKWPERGQGIKTYQWNGQTLTADFSQSVYRWDLMMPIYYSNNSQEAIDISQESCDAVALLMRDVGYACNMNYGLGSGKGSSGVLTPSSFCNFFDYDAGMKYLARSMCNADTWNSIIINELKNGYPLFYAADQSSESTSGHALVIDGYNGDGYYHFNFGWGEGSAGYYTMLTISYNYQPYIKYGIKKNEGGKPSFLFYTVYDFIYNPETGFLENRALACEDRDRDEGVSRQIALAVENIVTHEIQYLYINELSGGPAPVQFNFTEPLPDGDYILYPVVRINEEDPWQTFFFSDERQTFVDLNVTNGVKNYANNHISDNIREGVIVVDNIYYILNKTKHEATVTYKNDKYNSYSGDVTIPAIIIYKNKVYSVTCIGNTAFYECKKLNSVTIPNSITSIESRAFSYSGIKSIVIPNSVVEIGSSIFVGCNSLKSVTISNQLKTLPWSTFQSCCLEQISIPNSIINIKSHAFDSNPLTSIIIPSSVKSIENFVFSGCYLLTSIYLPKSITSIGMATFYGCLRLENIYLERTDPSAYNCAEDAFYDVPTTTCVLHVPVGCKEAYASTSPWSNFQNIVEDETLSIDNIHNHPNGDKQFGIYSISGMKMKSDNMNHLPRGIYIQGKKKIIK